MRKFFFLFLMFAVPVFGLDCNSRVVDNAGVINHLMYPVGLSGADVHIITDNNYPGTPEQLVRQYQSECPNWKSANGGVKNNLIVFVLFPNKHKVGLYTGQEWASAIDSGQIRSDMIPAFRDGDWGRGLSKGLNEAADMIFAYQHPKQTVVNETPTDFSGLWKFLMWSLAVLSLGGLVFLIYHVIKTNKENKAKRLAAQKDAVQARADAADYVNNNPDDGYAAERFARLSNSESMNPDGDFEADDYKVIAAAYRALLVKAKAYKANNGKSDIYIPPTDATPVPASVDYTSGYTDVEKTTGSTTVINKTTYIDNSPAYIPVPVSPVIVEEPVRDEPSWGHSWDRSSDSSRDDSSSSSSSDWSSSSSSSSWDSSSSSSSWSDSSSSSSFDSGSSFGDSGGGFSGGDSSW